MDQGRILAEMTLRLQHRHGDRFVDLERVPSHDAASTDPERDWGKGQIYRCPACAEEIRVVHPEPGAPEIP